MLIYLQSSYFLSTFTFQKALKDKNISVEEVEKDVLGTHNEKKAPDAHATES
jgi:hypothetical protein